MWSREVTLEEEEDTKEHKEEDSSDEANAGGSMRFSRREGEGELFCKLSFSGGEFCR